MAWNEVKVCRGCGAAACAFFSKTFWIEWFCLSCLFARHCGKLSEAGVGKGRSS